MNVKKVNYIVLSDIHLGHTINITSNIVYNLREYLKDNHNLFKKLDFMFIAGDIFDKLLSNNSPEYALAMEWLTEVALYCSHNHIKLRILEGTPSHDWKQASVFYTIIKKLSLNLDFKYIDTLYIENNEDTGLSILYVPDEHNNKASDTLVEVKELLRSTHLKSVDIAIMHGQFHYQLPLLLESSHDEREYLSLVKYYISIGHIHTSSVFKRILAQGSFDRLTHGEEEAKGAMYITLYSTGDSEYLFIKNKRAMLFNTLNCTDNDLDTISNDIKVYIAKHKKVTNIRLYIDAVNKGILKAIKKEYPYIKFKIKVKDTEDKDDILADKEIVIESFKITNSNIEELLFTEVNNHELSRDELRLAYEEFQTVYDNI